MQRDARLFIIGDGSRLIHAPGLFWYPQSDLCKTQGARILTARPWPARASRSSLVHKAAQP